MDTIKSKRCTKCSSFLSSKDPHTVCLLCRDCSPGRPCPIEEGWPKEKWDEVLLDKKKRERARDRSKSNLTKGRSRSRSRSLEPPSPKRAKTGPPQKSKISKGKKSIPRGTTGADVTASEDPQSGPLDQSGRSKKADRSAGRPREKDRLADRSKELDRPADPPKELDRQVELECSAELDHSTVLDQPSGRSKELDHPLDFPCSIGPSLLLEGPLATDQELPAVQVDASLDRDRAPMEHDRASLERDRAPMERGRAPMERGRAPMERDLAPMERDCAPMERGLAPMERDRAPMERGLTSLERDCAPMERVHAPMERSRAPLERDHDLSEALNYLTELERSAAQPSAGPSLEDVPAALGASPNTGRLTQSQTLTEGRNLNQGREPLRSPGRGHDELRSLLSSLLHRLDGGTGDPPPMRVRDPTPDGVISVEASDRSWSSPSSSESEEEEVNPRRAQKSAPSPSYEVIQNTPNQPVANQGVSPETDSHPPVQGSSANWLRDLPSVHLTGPSGQSMVLSFGDPSPTVRDPKASTSVPPPTQSGAKDSNDPWRGLVRSQPALVKAAEGFTLKATEHHTASRPPIEDRGAGEITLPPPPPPPRSRYRWDFNPTDWDPYGEAGTPGGMLEEEARDKLLTPKVSAPFFAAVLKDAQLPMEFDSPPPRTSNLGPVARPQRPPNSMPYIPLVEDVRAMVVDSEESQSVDRFAWLPGSLPARTEDILSTFRTPTCPEEAYRQMESDRFTKCTPMPPLPPGVGEPVPPGRKAKRKARRQAPYTVRPWAEERDRELTGLDGLARDGIRVANAQLLVFSHLSRSILGEGAALSPVAVRRTVNVLSDLLHLSAEHFVRLATRASIVRRGLVVGALNLSKPDDFLNAPFGGDLFGGKFSALFEKEKQLRKERAQSQKRPGSRGTKSQPQQSKPTFAWRTAGQVAIQPPFQQQQQLQQPFQTAPGWQSQPIAAHPPVQNPGAWQPPSQGQMRGNQRRTTSGRGRRHRGKRKPQRGGRRGRGGRGGPPGTGF